MFTGSPAENHQKRIIIRTGCPTEEEEGVKSKSPLNEIKTTKLSGCGLPHITLNLLRCVDISGHPNLIMSEHTPNSVPESIQERGSLLDVAKRLNGTGHGTLVTLCEESGRPFAFSIRQRIERSG